MNHPRSVRIDDQAVSARSLAVADKLRFSSAHLSAVDPGLLESVKDIINDSHMFSSNRQVCESSFTTRSSDSSPKWKRLLDPASYPRGNLSDVPSSVFGQEQSLNDDRSFSDVQYKFPRYATDDRRPGEQLPAVDPVKPDSVAGKQLDGWLPAPSGRKRKEIAEGVTGQNLPQALNVKSTSEDFPMKNLYQTRFDVKGRESGLDPRGQGYRDGYSASDKPPPSLMSLSVKDSYGRWSEDERVARQNAEGTFTSNETRGLPVNRSLVNEPGHHSQVGVGENTSTSVRQQRVEVALPGSDQRVSNSTCHTGAPEWRSAPVGYDAVSRTAYQGATNVDSRPADVSIAESWQFQTSNASHTNSDVVVARRIYQGYKRIEFESFGQTLMVLKTTSEDLVAPRCDSLESKGGRRGEKSYDSRRLSHASHRTEMSTSQQSNRESARDGDVQFSKRADPAQKVKPVEARERSRVEFGEEIVRRAQTDPRKVEDKEKHTSKSQSRYTDHSHRSSKQEPSDTHRKSSGERDQFSGGVRTTDSLRLKDQSKASTEENAGKSEERFRSKTSKTDELRTKFLLEIGRRERELRRIADNSASHSSSIEVRFPHAATAACHLEDDRDRWPMKPEPKEPSGDSLRTLEPRVDEKRYDSERTNSHTTKSLSGSVASSRTLQEHPSPRDEVTSDVRVDRSRKADENTSKEAEDFRHPWPPVKTGYRVTEPSVGEKPRNSSLENSADMKKQISSSHSYSRNTKDSATLSEHRSSSSSTRDSSARDGSQTSASVRDRTNSEREVRDGFPNEERVAFWENLKTQLDEMYSKKMSPVKSEHQTEYKSDSRSKDNYEVREERRTPQKEISEEEGRVRVKTEHTPKKENSEEQGRLHVNVEHTPKKDNSDEQGWVRVKMEHTSKKENSEEQGRLRSSMEHATKKQNADEQSRLRAKMEHTPQKDNSEEQGRLRAKVDHTPKKENREGQSKPPVTPKHDARPAEERSFSHSKEAKKDNVEIQDRLPIKTKQTVRSARWRSLNRSQKASDQDKAERQTIHPDQVRSSNRSEKSSGQDKAERQTIHPDQVRSSNRSEKSSGQDKAERQTTRSDQLQSLNRSQKVSDQDKVERQTIHPDQVHSLSKSQKVSGQEKVVRNVTPKQKTPSFRPCETVSKTDFKQDHKVFPQKTDEKRTADEKQTATKRQIVNKNVSKSSRQPVVETNKTARNGNIPRLETVKLDPYYKKLNETKTKQDDPRKSDDLRNLLNSSKPSNTDWRQREIKRQKDERSVVLKDDTGSELDELVIEVPGPRDDTMSVEFGSGGRREIEGLDEQLRAARRWRGVDDELDSELPRKRFKFSQTASERFARGGGFRPRGRGRRPFEECSKDDMHDLNQSRSKDRYSKAKIPLQGEFQHRYRNAVDLDDYYRHGNDDDADHDDRHQGRQEQYGNPDEEGYFHADDKSRIFPDDRNRYQGRSRDRHPTGGDTREQFPGEELDNQHQGDIADRYPGDADERFQRNDDEEYYEDGTKKYRRGNYSRKSPSRPDEERYPKRESDRESYDARYPNEDADQRDRGDYDDRFSDDYARKRFRQRSSGRYSNDDARSGSKGARYSNDDAEECCRGNRSARYSSDDGKEQYHSHHYGNDSEERFRMEDSTHRSVDDVGEQHQGSYTDRYAGKPNRGRFGRPNARTVTFDKLKGPRAFFKDLEEHGVDDDYAEEERPCDVEVTVEGDFYEDDYAWDRTDPGYQQEEGAIGDIDFDDSLDHATDSHEFDYGGRHDETVPLSPVKPLLTGARFGGPSRGSSFQTRSWRGKFFNRSARGNQFQPRFGHRRRFGFQPLPKKFLPPPKKFLRRMEVPEFAEQSGENISDGSNSMQEAIKQVMNNLKEAEMADPEADAELFDTLSRGEKKQVVEIQQMTGIQNITAIVTALRTLWEFEPKVVRTLGSLEPEEIKQLGDNDLS